MCTAWADVPARPDLFRFSSADLQALVWRKGQHGQTGDNLRVKIGAFLRHSLALTGDCLDLVHSGGADEKHEVTLALDHVINGKLWVAVVTDHGLVFNTLTDFNLFQQYLCRMLTDSDFQSRDWSF
jgi:hypothetical protein